MIVFTTPSYQLEMQNYLSGLLSNFLGAGNMQNVIANGLTKIPWWLIPVQLRPCRLLRKCHSQEDSLDSLSVWTSCILWSARIALCGLHHRGAQLFAKGSSVPAAHPHAVRFKTDLRMGCRQEERVISWSFGTLHPVGASQPLHLMPPELLGT